MRYMLLLTLLILAGCSTSEQAPPVLSEWGEWEQPMELPE